VTHAVRIAGAIVFAAAVLLLVTACSRDAVVGDIQSRVNDALKESRIDSIAPVWDEQRNELRLRGIVGSPDEKRLAEQVAADALGSRGTIVSEISVTLRAAPEPAPAVAEVDDIEQIDNRIQKDIEAIFAADEWKGRDINIMVREGVVYLSGRALNQDDKDRITEATARIAGVKQVINRLALKERD
jgi:osmotically-inducible protein OsmY